MGERLPINYKFFRCRKICSNLINYLTILGHLFVKCDSFLMKVVQVNSCDELVNGFHSRQQTILTDLATLLILHFYYLQKFRKKLQLHSKIHRGIFQTIPKLVLLYSLIILQACLLNCMLVWREYFCTRLILKISTISVYSYDLPDDIPINRVKVWY